MSSSPLWRSQLTEVTTATGRQQFAAALNQRVIYVDTIADLQALPTGGLVDGQAADLSNGQSYKWDSSASQFVRVLTPVNYRGSANSLQNNEFPELITERLDLSSGYLVLEGRGDEYPISVQGGSAGLYFDSTGAGTFDDHPHRKITSLRLVGDGSNTLLEHKKGSYFHHSFNVYEGGHTGAKVSSYVNDGFKNHYKRNTYGLHLDGVTSYREDYIYARSQNDPSGAAIYISGTETENVNLTGGALEGNRAPAIKTALSGTALNAFRLTLNDVYLELDGDKDAGTPSIDIQNDIGERSLTVVNGGKLSYNVLPDHPGGSWTSGDYNFGYNVVFNGARVSGSINSKNASLSGCSLAEMRFNWQEDPVLIHDYQNNTWTAGRNGAGGMTFSSPITGKPSGSDPYANLAPTSHPYVPGTSGNNTPTVTENTSDDYGDGSWTRIQFVAASGSVTSGWAVIGNNVDVTGNPFRVHCYLLKSDQSGAFGLAETGVGTAASHSFTMQAGKTYKMFTITNREIGGSNSLRMWPEDSTGAAVDVICFYQAMFDEQFEASGFISRMVRGS